MCFLLCVDITGVSPSEGSISGGTMITIYGEYFDPSADSIKVLVGGKLCDLYCTAKHCEGETIHILPPTVPLSWDDQESFSSSSNLVQCYKAPNFCSR